METPFQASSVSDVQLLEDLCSTEDDAQLYEQFVHRFLPKVQEECVNICKRRKLDLHIGKQIAHETFERVRKYKSFKADQVKILNTGKAIHVYLMRIATRQFNTFHANAKKEHVIHKTYFDDIVESTDESMSPEELQRKRDVAVAMFSQLSKREQKVVITDLEYKRGHKYLPDDVTEALAEELNIKKNTIRKIRERALQKLKKAINEISAN